MTQIVGLRGEKISEDGANESLVKLARDVLEQVERGEIAGLAVVAVRGNGEIGTLVCGPGRRHLLLAGAVYLQHDISDNDD